MSSVALRRWFEVGLLLSAVCAAPSAGADDDRAVVWHAAWPRFRWTEGVATVGLLTAAYVEDRDLVFARSPRWTGAILFDNEVRGLLRGRSHHLQTVASKYADIGYTTLTLFPYVDAGIALAVHRSPDVALQMFLIDAQSLSVTANLTNLTKWAVGRQRPYARDCGRDAKTTSHTCGTTYDNESFFSGHTSATWTGAALTCLHHQYLPLYGGGAADAWACIWAMTGATATGLLRIVSDDHYASDVLVGAATGLFSGYLLPALLHYGLGGATHAGPAAVMPVLVPVEAGMGIGLAGGL